MKRRLKACVEAWAGCSEGEYDPHCCRFPKSCSCTVYNESQTPDEMLEPAPEPREHLDNLLGDNLVLCQCANHHRWFGFPNVVNVCLTCSGAAINEYVMPVRRSGNVGDHLDQVLQARLSVECCCSVENGGTYCGQPECDIYYCHDCGDEFSEPCPRHEGVDHV